MWPETTNPQLPANVDKPLRRWQAMMPLTHNSEPLRADTHAQKSSTVFNLVTSCRLSCQARLRSFLKNHRPHLGMRREEGQDPHDRHLCTPG